jgi:O-antigen ligase
MNPSNDSRVTASDTPRLSGGLAARLLLFLAVVVAIFMAGGPAQGGMGLFLVVAGGVILCSPVSRVVEWKVWILGLLLVGTLSLPLLSERILGLPEWKGPLRNFTDILLHDSVSADPRATLFWVMMLLSSLLVGLYSLGSPLSTSAMRTVALWAVLACGAYDLLAWNAFSTGWHYPLFDREAWSQAAFGFFPNRNHTAGFLLSGAILSLGLIHRGLRGRGLLPAVFGALCFTLLAASLLFFSSSRAGLVFLVLGFLIWILGLGRQRTPLLVGLSIAVAVVLAAFFLSSGSGLLERFSGHPSGSSSAPSSSSPSSTLASDARFGIARDTFSIIADHPVTGTGLGTYALIYPFYADKSLRDLSTALHAESDWLTLASEGGLPSLLVALVLVALMLARIPRFKARTEEREWPLRWAFLSALLAELLHGLVDVPLHRPELGWWILLLGGVGFAGGSGIPEGRTLSLRIQRLMLILGALPMIVLGMMMIRGQWFGGPPMPPFAAATYEKRAVAMVGTGVNKESLSGAFTLLQQQIADYPMNSRAYFQLGALGVEMGEKVAEAKALYTAALHLSPHDPDLAYQCGKSVAKLEPLTAARFWDEALCRQLVLDNLPTSTVRRAPDLFGKMMMQSPGDPVMILRMPVLASQDPRLRMMWLASPDCDPAFIAESAQDPAFMGSLTPLQQGRVLDLWWRRGGKPEVAAFLDANPTYRKPAAATVVAELASSGRQESACRFLIETFAIPTGDVVHPSTPSPDASPDTSTTVPKDPLAAAKYYLARGNDVTALRLLGQAAGAGGGDAAEALRLQAALEMRAGDWSKASGTLLAYLRATGQL